MSRVVAPVNLGCCPGAPRCALCPPPPPAPAPETVAALVDHYRTERAGPHDVVRVGFYGGAPPDDALLDAVAGHPVQVRVRPDLLSRSEARRLVDRGVRRVELDVLTFADDVLREIGRRHPRALVVEMAEGLSGMGVEVGVVLAPGLPRSSHDLCVEDARIAAKVARFARIHPVLVLAEARLREWHMQGLYEPLPLGAAVTTCREMLDLLEAAGVDVIRVGLQPGPDGFGRAVAGPRHPSIRELVEARRVLDRLRRLVDDVRPGAHIVIRCAPADETRTRGAFNQHVRTLRAERRLASVRIAPDPDLPRGELVVDPSEDPS